MNSPQNNPPPRRIDRTIDRTDIAKFFATWGRRKPDEPETEPDQPEEPTTHDHEDK
jgi:hypothetical protein